MMSNCDKYKIKTRIGMILFILFPLAIYFVKDSSLKGVPFFIVSVMVLFIPIAAAIFLSPYMKCLSENFKSRNPF